MTAVESSTDSPSGRSKRGSHQLAAAMTCERMWWLRYHEGIVLALDKRDRMGGTLIHLAMAYYYASLMSAPPAWFYEKDLNTALVEKGKGFPDLVQVAKEVLVAYVARHPVEEFEPLYMEREFVTTIGAIDPGGPDATLDSEEVSCRPDLIASVGGMNFIVDHKSSGGGWGRSKKLPVWQPNGPYQLDWQVLWNLHVLRQHMPIEGFIIQRFKRESPYDDDRQILKTPSKPYNEAPRVMRAAAAHERENIRRAEAGIPPLPSLWACMGRFGPCDYRHICLTGDVPTDLYIKEQR